MEKIFKNIKIFLINILVLFISILIIECFFGYWFKNELSERLSSERNIERIYKFNFSNHKGTSFYKRNNQGFRVSGKEMNENNPDIIFWLFPKFSQSVEIILVTDISLSSSGPSCFYVIDS